MSDFKAVLLFCQPRVEVTSCFVYKVMGLTFHNRINAQLIYRFKLAQVVVRRITKPQRKIFRFESHWLLFSYFKAVLLFCQPRVEVTSCFVYKVMGLTFHNRINAQLIYRFKLAQVVVRRITKPQRKIFRFESHWLLFFYSVFFFFWGGGGGGGGV